MQKKLFTKILICLTSLLLVSVLVLGLIQRDRLGTANSGTKKFTVIEVPDSRKSSADAEQTAAQKKTAEQLQTLSLEDLNQAAKIDDFAAQYSREQNELSLREITDSELQSDIRIETVREEIPFDTLEYYADWVEPGESVITMAGVKGEALVTYENTYSPLGKLIEQKEIAREVKVEPIPQEIAVGEEITEQDQAKSPVQEDLQTESTQVETPVMEQTMPPASTPAEHPEPSQSESEQSKPENPAIPETEPVPPATSDIQFTAPGSNEAAFANHALIAGMLKANGNASYNSYTVNDDQTITVDGVTFAYDYTESHVITGYDGLELNNYETASGMRTTRGIVSTVFPRYGGFPFGTVLFIEGYGLVVVADYNGMGEVDASWLDVCFYDGETVDGRADPGISTRTVYVLSTP